MSSVLSMPLQCKAGMASGVVVGLWCGVWACVDLVRCTVLLINHDVRSASTRRS